MASEVGRGGEEEGADSCCLLYVEDELFFPVTVLGLVGPEAESVSASASRSQPESSNTMSKEEEVQSLGPRGEQSSKELGVSETSASAWLSLSDIRLSCPGIGWKDKSLMSTSNPTAPLALLDDREQASTEASRASPSGPEPGDAELDTGTLTDSASMWSRKLIGQSVALKKRRREDEDGFNSQVEQRNGYLKHNSHTKQHGGETQVNHYTRTQLYLRRKEAYLASFSHLWSISSCQPSGGLSCHALK